MHCFPNGARQFRKLLRWSTSRSAARRAPGSGPGFTGNLSSQTGKKNHPKYRFNCCGIKTKIKNLTCTEFLPLKYSIPYFTFHVKLGYVGPLHLGLRGLNSICPSLERMFFTRHNFARGKRVLLCFGNSSLPKEFKREENSFPHDKFPPVEKLPQRAKQFKLAL